jgi:hypothetical protein
MLIWWMFAAWIFLKPMVKSSWLELEDAMICVAQPAVDGLPANTCGSRAVTTCSGEWIEDFSAVGCVAQQQAWPLPVATVVDGADGARFTSHLCMMLSDVRRLLL